MYRDAGAWHAIMGRLARGRDTVSQCPDRRRRTSRATVRQLGRLPFAARIIARFVLPHTKAVIDNISPRVPVIHFAAGNPALLPLVAEAGGDVIGVDWRIGLDDAWQIVGHDRAVQGNLDPVVLLSEPAEILRQTHDVLSRAAGRPGHIFNLGHGILPQTPVDNVLRLIDAVRETSAR